MKKFRLDMNELRVESFDPVLPEGSRAGVHAHQAPTEDYTCRIDVCSGDTISDD